MKNNKFKKIFTIFLAVLILTGCATQLKYNKESQEQYYTEITKQENPKTSEEESDEDYNKRIAEIVKQKMSDFDEKNDSRTITIEETGQVLTKNILCKPSEELDHYYIENLDNSEEERKRVGKTELDDYKELPKCENFKLTSGGYEGVWTSIIVKPLAWLIIQLGKIVNNYGVGLIFASLLIRLVIFPITKKTAIQSELMKQAKPDLDRLEKKYAGKTDQESMMKKSREMAAIYKKYDIKPIAGCLFAFLQIPLFIGFYEAIQRVPAIFEGSLLGVQLGTTPITGLTNGNFIYLILSILVGATTYYSLTLNSASNPDNKQMQSMTKVMFIMILVMSFIMTSALNIYWIATNLFTVVQNLLVIKKKAKV
jgi:YidC/Oxa1 family membrane protein insertase